MKSLAPLPAVRVGRHPPTNLVESDRGLFAHEYDKAWGACAPESGAWDYCSDGLLLAPGTGAVDARSFQGAFPSGLAGAKVRLKGLRARWTYPIQPATVSADTVPLVITDEFSNGYFHWIADALPKLWWVKDRLDEFTLVLPAFANRFRYMGESLALWPDLARMTVEARTRTRLAEALVLPSLAPTGNYRPELIRGLAEDWRRFAGPAAPSRKVFISRAKAPWRKIANEDAVWAVLGPRGFERVFLEDLNFAAQVKLLAETELLVSNHGAGLTNLMFMVPGTRVVEIRLRGDRSNNCYFSLASAVGADYAYLLADAVSGQTDSHTADLIVDPAALARVLEALG